jgi:type VI secretion system protein ImpL
MDLASVTASLAKLDVAKTSGLTVAIVIGLVLLAWWLRRMLRKPKIVGIAVPGDGCVFCASVRSRFARLLDALDYLATRREWRYAQPWVLVLGGKGAGKSSLVASVSANERHPKPGKADELKADGMQWSFLRRGVLIDADGALANASEGSDGARAWARAWTCSMRCARSARSTASCCACPRAACAARSGPSAPRSRPRPTASSGSCSRRSSSCCRCTW